MILNKLVTWIRVLRLPSTLLAWATIWMGNFLAMSSGSYRPKVGWLALSTAVLLQIVANLANDYGDYIRGSNVGNRVGLSKKASIKLPQLQKGIFLFSSLAALCGLLLLQAADLAILPLVLFLLLGFLSIVAAITYTMGSYPYAYKGGGDIAVFLFFGPIGIMGSLYLHTHTLDTINLLPAISGGLLSVAVLNVNNLRDQALDAAVAKKTWVVRWGRQAGLYYQWGLLGGSMGMLVIFTCLRYQSPWQWLFLAAFPLLINNGLQTTRYTGQRLDSILGQLVGLYLLTVILFGLGLQLAS